MQTENLVNQIEVNAEKQAIYAEPKWKLYNFIIQIANTISNQCISLCHL